MGLTPISDHAARALDRVLLQYREKPKLKALIELHAGRVQEIEDRAFEFLNRLVLPTAIGAQLDRIGGIVGQAREGRDDDTYRIWIAARIRLNLGSGTVPELVDLFAPLLPATAIVAIHRGAPAEFSLTIGNDVLAAGDYLPFLQLLREAKPGGVRATLHWTEDADAFLFKFGAGPGFDNGFLSGVAE